MLKYILKIQISYKLITKINTTNLSSKSLKKTKLSSVKMNDEFLIYYQYLIYI